MNLIFLLLFMRVASTQYCMRKHAVEACIDGTDPFFSVSVSSSFDLGSEVQSNDILLVGEKPLGPPVAVPPRSCHFPNRMGRNRESSINGTRLSQLYLGMVNQKDFGKSPVCHSFCSESYCPEINAPSCRTLLITFEGSLKGKNVLAFLVQLALINPLTSITCYLKDFQKDDLEAVKFQKGIPPICNKIFLEMGYSWDLKKKCPFKPEFPDISQLNSNFSPVFLTIPIFGYDLTTFDNGFSNKICKGSFVLAENLEKIDTCLKPMGSNCHFASPLAVWDLVSEQHKKGNIEGFFLLPSALLKSSDLYKNQLSSLLSPRDIHVFLENLGREYALSDTESNCWEITTDSIDECIWVEYIDLTDSGFCVGEDLESGYVGRVVCDFSCKNLFTATVCDVMTCHEMSPVSKSKKYIYWKLQDQIAIESGGQYGWVDGQRTRKCLGRGRFLICEGTDTPGVMCNRNECWSAEFIPGVAARLGQACRTVKCLIEDKPVTTRNLLQIESVSDCRSQLIQDGLKMRLVSMSSLEIASSCLQSKNQRKCIDCSGVVCELTVDLDFSESGSEVLADCDGVVTPLIWATKYNTGERVGMPQIDYVLTTWSSADKYWKWILVFAALAFIQMTVWTVKLLNLHILLKKTLICVFKVTFTTPSFLKEIWRNFFWFRRRYHYCPGCGGDLNFLDHRDIECPQTEHYCTFPISGGVCGETISESQSHFRHWVLLHLPSLVMKVPFWINPLNIWKYYQVKTMHKQLLTKRQEIEEIKERVIRSPSPRVKRHKSFPTPLLGVSVLCLVSPCYSTVNLAPSLTCNKGLCRLSTSGIMDNLYSGSLSCFKTSSEGANLEFCLTVKSVLVTGTAQVVKCRVNPDIKFFGTFRCTNAWAINWYQGEVESYKDCTQFAYRNEARVGGYEWGCSLPNANSIFVKGFLVDSKLPTPCIIDTTGSWAIKTVLCMSIGGVTECDNAGDRQISLGGVNVTYTTEFPGKIDLPDRLVVMPDGSFRRVLDEGNGCFLFSKKKIGGRECSYPINYPPYACGYTIDLTTPSGVRGHCSVPDEKLCEEPLSFPLFNTGSCFLSKAIPSVDSNSFLITGKGCTTGQSSLRFEIIGIVEVAPVTGSVLSINVHDCVGYSGISGGASCLVFPNCDGKVSICSLTSPVVIDVPCQTDTRVYFSASTGSNLTFACGSASVHHQLNLTIIMPQKDTSNFILSAGQLSPSSSGFGAGYTFLVIVAIIAFAAVAVWITLFVMKKVKELKSNGYSEKML